jgi:hypothetical protein
MMTRHMERAKKLADDEQDMHYAEFAEDEVRDSGPFDISPTNSWHNPQSQALLNAIKEYETNKWKVIGAKVGKPAKVWCPNTKS